MQKGFVSDVFVIRRPGLVSVYKFHTSSSCIGLSNKQIRFYEIKIKINCRSNYKIGGCRLSGVTKKVCELYRNYMYHEEIGNHLSPLMQELD